MAEVMGKLSVANLAVMLDPGTAVLKADNLAAY